MTAQAVLVPGAVFGTIGALAAFPLRLAAREVERQHGQLRRGVTRRTTHVVFGRPFPAKAGLTKNGDAEIERLHAAQQREPDQHRGADDDFHHREARALDGVIGGALVRRQRDGRGELRRHLITVRRHEAGLPRREPEFGSDHRHDGDHEQNGEVQSRHPGGPWYLCENYMFVPAGWRVVLIRTVSAAFGRAVRTQRPPPDNNQGCLHD